MVVGSAEVDDEVLKSPQRWFALMALLGATFIGTMSNNIVNVATPAIAKDFSAPINSAVWVSAGFALALATMMPLAGRLGDIFGSRRVFLIGLLVFSFASVLLAVSPNLPCAIFGRLLQGASGAPVLPCVMSTITRIFPEGHRGRAIGMWAAVNSSALALAPAIGGWVVDAVGWRAIFWLSAPAMIAVGSLVMILVPADKHLIKQKLDIPGIMYFMLTVVNLVVFVSLLERFSSLNIGWIALSGFSFIVLYQLTQKYLKNKDNSFINFEIFNSLFKINTLIASLQMVVLFSATLLVPVYLVSGLERSNSFAGGITATLAAWMLIGSIISGRLSERIEFSTLAFIGGCLILFGLAIMFFYIGTSVWLICGLSLCGIGISLIQTPSTVAITFSVKKGETGAAMGLFNMSRFLFGGLGATLASTFFELGTALNGEDSPTNISSFRMGLVVPIVATIGILALSLCRRPKRSIFDIAQR